MKQARLAERVIEGIETELRQAYTDAVYDGAALRGERGRDAQDRALLQWSARYKALKAEGKTAEAEEIREMIFRTVPMKGGDPVSVEVQA